MEKTANRIASFFIAQGAAEEDDRDIYVYGLTIGLSTAQNILLTALVGFLLGVPLKALAFILPFAVTRLFAGGAHAKTAWGCAVSSAAILASALLLIRFTPETAQTPATLGLLTVSAALVFLFAPAEHPNRPISPRERATFRRRSRAIALVTAGICVGLILMQIRDYPFCISLGLAAAGATLTPGTIKRR
ncbi:MAG: accessory gene regulator B family protein [Oscillospiraceae bacterium]|nr:accessory gene regulator B family protein [Oscillospiraceae bacterium]